MSSSSSAEAKKARRAQKKIELVRRINDMMPVPDVCALDLVLSLKSRMLVARVSASPLSGDHHSMIRRLLGDLVTTTAVQEHLAVLFEKSDAILAMVESAREALVRMTADWKASKAPAGADLDAVDDCVDIFYDMLRQTKLSEYKTVLQLVEKELARPRVSQGA